MDLRHPYDTSGGENFSVVKSLKQLKMSPIELVTTLLVPQDVYRDNADVFCRSQGLENLLNLVSRDNRGRKKLNEWYENKFGLDPLLREVHREMDDLSTHFRRSTSEVTPDLLLEFDFERDVTELCRQHTPRLRQILLTAAQTPRAAKENTMKDPEPIVDLIHLFTLANYSLAEYPGASSDT